MKIGIFVLMGLALIGLVSAWKSHLNYVHPDIWVMPEVPRGWHLDRYLFYTLNPNDDWPRCTPGFVEMVWAPSEGWMAVARFSLRGKTFSGGMSNGISYSAPFLGGTLPTLTTSQFQLLQNLRLPLGESYETSRLHYATELHIAYEEGGVPRLRHYPIRALPPEVLDLFRRLGLIIPEQK